MKIEENVSLAPLTSLRVGGAARFFVRAESEADCSAALDHARENNLDVLVLGGGSNVLVSDEGFDGLVIQIAIKGIVPSSKSRASSLPRSDLGRETRDLGLTAGAGEQWDSFVAHCVDQDLAGVENLSGIPGFVGATPVQNVGAYGQEVSERIVSVRCIDRACNEIVELSNAECAFAYRASIFNSTARDRYVVMSVTYNLTPGGAPKIEYKDLLDFFEGRTPSLQQVRDAVLEIRRGKSMVIDAGDPNSRSAGSFFKNPIVEISTFEEIRRSHESVPHFVNGDKVKIPAAWLIENAGINKGFILGNAGISTKHTLAIINRGQATAAEIIALKDHIQAAVAARFGITLVPEPVLVGF